MTLCETFPLRHFKTSSATAIANYLAARTGNGFHMVFCDGSVQMISFSIDHTIHLHLGNREDGYVIDAKQY